MSFKENVYIPAIAEPTLYFNGIYYMMTVFFFSSRIVSVSILLVVFFKKDKYYLGHCPQLCVFLLDVSSHVLAVKS